MAGTFKEILTVAASVFFLGERLSLANCFGLFLCIVGILAYQRLKAAELRRPPQVADREFVEGAAPGRFDPSQQRTG